MAKLINKLCVGSLFALLLVTGTKVWASQEPVITITGVKVDAESFDGEQISKALDAYVAPLIDGHIKLEFVELERYDQVFSKYDVSGRMPDVFFFPSSKHLSDYYEHGRVLALDELLDQHGQGIVDAVGEETLKSQMFGDNIYAVPCLHDQATCNGFEYRVDIAEKYNLDMDSVHDFDGLTAVFRQLSEKAGDIIPCSDLAYKTWDPLTDNLGVLMDYGKEPVVTNLYTSQAYEKYYEYIYLWQKEGYILSDDIGLISGNRYVSSPEIFGKFVGLHPGLVYVDSADAGEEIAAVRLTPSFLYSSDTGTMRSNGFAISSACPYPEIAMKFLNLMYTDSTVMNLLTYGIEGKHYQIIDKEQGVIDFAQGTNRKSSDYTLFRGYLWGNQFLTYTWQGYPTDLWEQVQEFNTDAPHSSAFGFKYNPENVASEVYACTQIVNTYEPVLNAGVGSLKEVLNEFRSRLKDAGIDRIIKEKQRQLDLFLAEKEEK